MSRILTLMFVLLCSAAWLQAQDQYPQNPTTGSSQTKASSGQTSVEGCLQGSNGNFTLTDSSGTAYQLQGDTAKLSKHVGHEVKITGSPSGASAAGSSAASPSGASSSSGMGSSQTLTVSKLKHISESCKTSMSK
jgi:hypothetical protein